MGIKVIIKASGENFGFCLCQLLARKVVQSTVVICRRI